MRISLRPTGLPWNLTLANATEKVRDGDSSRLLSASIDREKFRGERLQPDAAYWCCRPKAGAASC